MGANPVLTARQLDGDRMAVAIRGHLLTTDQPVEDGGGDSAPTPTELFLAGLTACVGFYAQRFLRRHQLSTEGLEVSCDWEWAEGPHRVGPIRLDIDAPSLTLELAPAFRRVVEHCTVHNTLLNPPTVEIDLAPAALPVAAGARR